MIAYVIAAMVLGVYFAFSSGTVDSIVYDTVVEETGSNELYETWIGRIRAVESAAFVLSCARRRSARAVHLGPLHLLRHHPACRAGDHRVPALRRAAAAPGQPSAVTLRSHVALTFRTMVTSRAVLRVLLLVATAGLLVPGRLRVRTALAGRAGGAGHAVRAVLGGAGLHSWHRRPADRQAAPGAPADGRDADYPVVGHGAGADLDPLPADGVAAQVVLALVLALLGIHASRLLHDAVPSSIRAGVSSGAGTLTWVMFLPFSLVFGWTARDSGIATSGFMLVGVVVILSALLILSVRASRGTVPVEVAATAKQEAIEVTQQADEMACKQLVELVADYLDDTLSPDMKARFEEHLTGCDGCSTYLKQTQQIIAELRHLSSHTRQ